MWEKGFLSSKGGPPLQLELKQPLLEGTDGLKYGDYHYQSSLKQTLLKLDVDVVEWWKSIPNVRIEKLSLWCE